MTTSGFEGPRDAEGDIAELQAGRAAILAPIRHRRLWLAAILVGLFALVAGARVARAQPDFEFPDEPPAGRGNSGRLRTSFEGALQLLEIAGGPTGTAEALAATEIFPDARKVWLHVQGTDPRGVEGARRGARPWVCSNGCKLTSTSGGPAPAVSPGDTMLVSIKAQTPTQPLPLTIWRPTNAGRPTASRNTYSRATSTGRLMFDPVLLGRRSYRHVCAYGPIDQPSGPGADVEKCQDGSPMPPTPDSVELSLGFQWPISSDLADFQYIAVVDGCGNARVQPFQRTFSVPVFEVASGGCGDADGKILRVFPSGSSFRVTAFNLDHPATGSVVSATFRVAIPALEDVVSAENPPMLFPDPLLADLVIDCGPELLKASAGPGGIPRHPQGIPPGAVPPGAVPPGAVPPGAVPPGAAPPGAAPPPPPGVEPPGGSPDDEPALDDEEGDGPEPPRGKHAEPIKPVPIQAPRVIPDSQPGGQPLAHQGLVIAPEPLLRGNCRIELRGQTKRRLVAPLALHVLITRTDSNPAQVLVQKPWTVTPNDATFRIPQMVIDGESRLRIEVYSDPLSADGNIVLLSDAGRLGRVLQANPENVRRLIGSVTVYSAPLCGESNFETVEAAGSCVRGYFTVPAMLATLQITRAPWVEQPLITRKILGAVGLAFAVDSYDPVEREAFPIAFQVGGFIQDLDDQRIGILSYVGVAPTVPILGEGGNTTSIGLLAGLGIEYITNARGPDEGFKPAAFVSVVVQVGQANPSVTGNYATFGQVQGTPVALPRPGAAATVNAYGGANGYGGSTYMAPGPLPPYGEYEQPPYNPSPYDPGADPGYDDYNYDDYNYDQ